MIDAAILKEKMKHTAPIAPYVNNTVLKNLILILLAEKLHLNCMF